MKNGVQAEGASRAGCENGGKGPVGEAVGTSGQCEGASWTGCGDWLTERRGKLDRMWGLVDSAKGPVGTGRKRRGQLGRL